jgi:hypothetical protein
MSIGNFIGSYSADSLKKEDDASVPDNTLASAEFGLDHIGKDSQRKKNRRQHHKQNKSIEIISTGYQLFGQRTEK